MPSGARAKQKSIPQRLSETDKAGLIAKRPTERFRVQGWAVLPQSIFTHADKFAPGGAQLLAVQRILYLQLSTQETPDWVKVSPAGLARLTNGAYTAKSFDIALADAARRGMVEREKRGRDWWYRVFPEDWAAALDYEAPKLAVMPEPDAAEPDAAEPDAAAEFVPSGRTSRRVPINVHVTLPDRSSADVPLEFTHRNESGVPLVFRAAVAKGVVQFTVSRGHKGEDKAKSHRRLLPEIPKRAEHNQRLNDFRAAISAALENRWQKPLEEAFFTRVVGAAGTEIPVADFVARFEADAASLARKRKPVESGLLIWSAEQARKHWESQAATRAKREEHNAQLRAAAAPPSFDASGDETVWPQVRAAIRKQVTAESYANWFAPTRGEGVSEEGTLLVAVVDAPTAEYLAEEHEIVLSRLAHALDPRIQRIQFFVGASKGRGAA